MMKRHLFFWLALAAALCASCGPGASSQDVRPCPQATGTPHTLTTAPGLLPTPERFPTPVEVEIGGKTVLVDRVVEGPLCNGTWSGTVYVACDVQVYPWEGKPTFLEDCNLTIEPGTVVYVAAHGDRPYYQGCTCHTGAGEP